MTCFFAVKTSPNMIGLTVKNIIIKKQLKFFFKVPGVLFILFSIASRDIMAPAFSRITNLKRLD